jgi:hypothetical protein
VLKKFQYSIIIRDTIANKIIVYFSFFVTFCLFYLSVFLSFCLSVFLSFCLSVFLSFCLSVFLSSCLSLVLLFSCSSFFFYLFISSSFSFFLYLFLFPKNVQIINCLTNSKNSKNYFLKIVKKLSCRLIINNVNDCFVLLQIADQIINCLLSLKTDNELFLLQIADKVRRFFSLLVIMGIPLIGEVFHAFLHGNHAGMTNCYFEFEVSYSLLLHAVVIIISLGVSTVEINFCNPLILSIVSKPKFLISQSRFLKSRLFSQD